MSSSCPTQNMGKSEQCQGCPNQKTCSTMKEDDLIKTIKQNLSKVKLTLAIMSGKGGVGKSTITRNISHFLSLYNYKVLVLDLDLSGPSLTTLFNMQDYTNLISENYSCIKIKNNLYTYKINKNSFYNSSTKTNTIRHLLSNIDNKFDIIVLDTPPNITDEHLAILNYLNTDYSILVSTPQLLSFQDVLRQYTFCVKGNIKILGLIENMKKFKCIECKHEQDVFFDSNIKKECEKYNIDYLGSLDINIEYGKKSDNGEVIDEKIFKTLSEKIINLI